MLTRIENHKKKIKNVKEEINALTKKIRKATERKERKAKIRTFEDSLEQKKKV